MIHGAPAKEADAEGLGVGHPQGGFYRQVARFAGSDKDSMANLRFLAAEAVEGVLQFGAHIYAAEAHLKIQQVNLEAHSGGGGDGVLVIGLRVEVVGIPAIGHGAERIAKAQRVNAFAGREGEGGVG